MILDARALAQDALISADVCIAGAGAAGITLARELLASGLRVILLESGDYEPQAATQGLCAGSVEAGGFAFEYSLTETRQRCFGGTTNHWGGWCRPLDPEDFEARSWLPRSGWPMTRDELASFYDRAQSLCQLGARDFDAARIASLVDRPVLPFDPARVETIIYLMSPPTRFGTLYRDELASAGNLSVYLNANLVNIRLAPAGGVIDSFECATLSGVTFRVAAARYVLALGGVENARMMLASNRQEPAGIGNRNDLVGRCFMEHPSSAYYWSAVVAASTEFDYTFYTSAWTIDGVRVVPGLRLARSLRARMGLAGMSITLADAGSVDGSSVTGRLSPRQASALLRSSKPSRLLQAAIRGEQRPSAKTASRCDRSATHSVCRESTFASRSSRGT